MKIWSGKLTAVVLAAAMAGFTGAALPIVQNDSGIAVNAARYGDYEYEINDDGTLTITKYHGYSDNLIIPSVIDGKTVTAIGEMSIWYSDVKHVTIPDTVKSIGNGAFYDDEKLESVSLPDGLETLCPCAFQSCKALKSITIPDSVTTIQSLLFQGCSSLESVNLPSGVTSIGRYAFDECDSLRSISIPEGLESIGEFAFSECKSLNSIVLPDSVTTLERSAFMECESLTSAVLSSHIKKLDTDTFRLCTSLSSITIPAGIEDIHISSFEDCSSLTDIFVEEDNPQYSSIDGVLFDKSGKVLMCCPAGKTSVSIPNGITEIGYRAFYDCGKLTSIKIPYSVKKIGMTAFCGCSLIETLSIPTNVSSIRDGAFIRCPNLKSVVVYSDNPYFCSRDGVLFDKDRTILLCVPPKNTTTAFPKTLTTIGEYAFYQCTDRTSITIPDSVTLIDYYAFYGCTNLKKITIPGNVTQINGEAFERCSSLESIVIPDSVTVIDWYCFAYCNNLESIVIPDSVTSIGSHCFAYCDNLESITIPASVTEIGDKALFRCSSELRIFGYAGTAAELFASRNGLSFVAADRQLPTGVTISKTNVTLYKGTSQRLTATVIPDEAYDKTIRWFTSDAETVMASADGLITGKSLGTATVTAKAINGVKAVCEVTVVPRPALINHSTLNSDTIQLGSKVRITGAATGGIAPYQYAYYFKRSNNTEWNRLGTGFSTSTSATFTPTSASVFDVKVIVKDIFGDRAVKDMQVTVRGQLENGAVINSEIVGVGDKVRVAANAGGGVGPYTFAYYYKRHANTKWNVLGTEFGTNSSVSFTPTAEAVYDVKVVVKDSAGATVEKFFNVEAKKDLELTNVSVLSRTSVKLGGSIPVLGKAVGGKGSYSYAFYFKRSTNTKWNVLGTEFGTETTARLKPTAKADYDIKVIVKDSSGKQVSKLMTAAVK